jgi:RNA polymerase sigma factor (sigma-70 family)
MFESDGQLLHRYVEHGSQDAFGELVRRHTDFVYAAARRQMGRGSADQAEDIMQAVFILLARKAKDLLKYKSLTGWLFLATRNVASAARRSERRRRHYERAAAAEVNTTVETKWPDMEEVIDDAMAELAHREREVILLRFFQQQPFDEIATTLGTTQDAARVRLGRAVAKLRQKLVAREVVAEVAVIEALLLAHAQVAAPATIAAAALNVAAAVKAGTAATLPATSLLQGTFLMASVKTKVIATAAAVALLAGSSAVVVKAIDISRARAAAAAQAEALPPIKVISFQARRDPAAADRGLALPDDLKKAQIPEEFKRFKTPFWESATFSGRVEGLNQTEGAEVGIVTMRGVQWTSSRNFQWEPIKPDGTFSITANTFPTERRALQVRAIGQATTFLRAEFEADESASDIVVRMKPSKTVTLKLRDTKDSPVPTFNLEQFNAFDLQDDQGRPLELQRFAIKQGQAGKVDVVLPLEPVGVLMSGTGVAPYYQIIDPREADAFEIKMMSAARVKGIVTKNGEPVENFAVYLVNDAAPMSAIYRKTNKDGGYTLTNGVPGTYRLRAKNKHATVEVGEGETKEVNFAL